MQGVKIIDNSVVVHYLELAIKLDLYGPLGDFERMLQKRNIKALTGLKRTWNKGGEKIDIIFISWPKCCRMIFYCHGAHGNE